jgi:hypothetical protein
VARGIAELLSRPDLEAQSAAMIGQWCQHRNWGTMGERLTNIFESCALDARYHRAIQQTV